MQRNSRSAAPSVTHQRGRPGRSIARWLPSLRPNRCSVGVLRSSPMQAAIPTPLRLTIAAPFGRGPHWNTARVLNVAASSHATLAEPRLVARTSPSSATAPATPLDHLDAIARGVGYEDPPGLRVKRRVVKLAVCGVGYLDDAKFLQRHDGLPARCHHDRLRSEARRMGGPSMRNLLEVRVLRRAWTGSRLAGSLRVPVF